MNNNLSSETKALLERYFDAAANLYGIISLYKLLEIYNSQNNSVSEEDFLSFVEELDVDHKNYYIVGEDEFYDDVDETLPINRDLVAEYILFEDCDPMYYKIKEAQSGKRYYVPDKEKLLKYEDDFYYEKTLSLISFRAFLRNQPELTKEKADDIVIDICLGANVDLGSIENAISSAEMMGCKLTEANIDEFIRLFTDMYNDTRLHINCGHTPNEMFGRRWY